MGLQRLRVHVTDEAISQLRDHLKTTYARFLVKNNITIKLNGETLTPQCFENWAYPPNYSPRRYTGTLKTEEGRVYPCRSTSWPYQRIEPGRRRIRCLFLL